MPTSSRPALAPVALLLGLGLVIASGHAAAQSLTPTEEAIARYVDEHTEEAIGFLERVVNINSGTMNHAGVREVGRAFEEELTALGFDVRWIDMPAASW